MKNINLMKSVIPCAVLAILLLCSLSLQGQVAAPSDNEVKVRIEKIQNALESGQTSAQVWWYGWMGIYGAATAVQAGLSAHHWNDFERNSGTFFVKKRSPEFGQDMLVGGVTTFLGVCGLLINPFTPAYAADRLRAMPDTTPEERRLKLLAAEELLYQCAQVEREGWGWLNHFLNAGVNLAAGLVIWLGFNRPVLDGILMFVEGEAVSLINIFTQPRRAIRDYESYHSQYYGHRGPDETQWFVAFYPVGLVFGTRF